MIVPFEEAHLIISGWKDSKAMLHIRHQGRVARFEGAGVVLQLSPTVVELGGESWSMFFPLGGAKFTFSDPREIPVESVRRVESQRYEFGLSAVLSETESLVLLQRRMSEDD